MAKTKLPKRVGGVKIPKKVRKQAKKAIALIETPAVRDLAIAGLTMAAERLAPGKSDGSASRADQDEPGLGDVLRQSAIEGARRFLAGFEEGQREARPDNSQERAAPRRRKASGRVRRPAGTAAGE